MKKNNKGFFLAETIVMIALVTTIMVFVYPNVTKIYENYNNRLNYYDQTEDVYTLRAIDKIIRNKTDENDSILENLTEKGCKKLELEGIDYTDFNIPEDIGLEELYITNYMGKPSSTDYNFNKYLKRLVKSSTDNEAYRLIGVFNVDGKKRYASVKIENPNPDNICGGS